MDDIGQRIKHIRKINDMTQIEFSSKNRFQIDYAGTTIIRLSGGLKFRCDSD
jgi:hypothetical protein